MKMPTADEFKARAQRVFNEAKFQDSEIAVITIAAAIMNAWTEGAETVLDDQLARLNLMSADVDKQKQPF